MSIAIAACVLILMVVFWYPPPLFQVFGGTELAMLIIGIDVALGPIITLIIFDARKKLLFLDLAVIVILQFAALGYGIYAMSAGRPAFIGFVGNHFAIVAANELEPEMLAEARLPEFRTLSLSGPKLVAVEIPTDRKEVENIMFAGLMGLGAQHVPKYYIPYEGRRSAVIKESLHLDDLKNLTDEENALIHEATAHMRREGREPRYLPVVTKRAVLTAIVDPQNGDLIRILAIDPFRKKN